MLPYLFTWISLFDTIRYCAHYAELCWPLSIGLGRLPISRCVSAAWNHSYECPKVFFPCLRSVVPHLVFVVNFQTVLCSIGLNVSIPFVAVWRKTYFVLLLLLLLKCIRLNFNAFFPTSQSIRSLSISQMHIFSHIQSFHLMPTNNSISALNKRNEQTEP